MSERIGQKYTTNDQLFAIQQLQQTGYSIMPRPHVHTGFELYYLLQGERVYFINGKIFTAQKGDTVIVVPGDLHSTASSQVEHVERVLIQFDPRFIPQPERQVLELPPFLESTLLRVPLKEQDELENSLLYMLTECKEHQAFYESYIRQLLIGLLIRLHRIGSLADNSAESQHPMHQKVSEITAHIHTHFSEPITLEQLAGIFFISPSYLSRVFLKLTGFHLSEYIRIIRVREAQKLLRTTTAKIQQIAEHVGFEHISHFNKTFKKVSGCSPLQYRKQHVRS
ncbi:AraC family transcriptional regulator of arabinose operon [Paenibacillus sp. V4I3]|uniref:AraC family transcriptional regulator n=1 Tax=Paenibacillus sp. V4I3 TaxID=3042305 RepID=UPI00278B417E|nr:AraC family transcriptional regulator [Paenibacillus sp. V4I3]MDQ0877401.1 AraC family transcriptional regulator of arabinose operon [Paenibacillus sp. V4I3]